MYDISFIELLPKLKIKSLNFQAQNDQSSFMIEKVVLKLLLM